MKTLFNRPFLHSFLYLILDYDHETLDTVVLGYDESSPEISCYYLFMKYQVFKNRKSFSGHVVYVSSTITLKIFEGVCIPRPSVLGPRPLSSAFDPHLRPLSSVLGPKNIARANS